MPSDHASVETARINARQAIVVALITGAVAITTTLLATGTLGGGGADATSRQGATTSTPAVLEAPVQHFSAKPTSLSLDACLARAGDGLRGMEMTGIEQGAYFAWGYRAQTTGLVWCHTDEGLVIFLAAGRDAAAAAEVATGLRRAF